MNAKFKLIALTTALLLASASLAGCGGSDSGGGAVTSGSGETTADSATSETTAETTSALSTVEKQDYEGYEFKIISTTQDSRQVDVIAEEENGATLNDLVYRRNQTVEETFNITISATGDEYSKINSLIQKDAQAGDCSYDLYMTNSTAYTLATAGYLAP